MGIFHQSGYCWSNRWVHYRPGSSVSSRLTKSRPLLMLGVSDVTIVSSMPWAVRKYNGQDVEVGIAARLMSHRDYGGLRSLGQPALECSCESDKILVRLIDVWR